MKPRAIFGLLALCAATSAAGQSDAKRFDLVCLGGGAANKATYAQANAWDSNGGYASANVVGNRSVPFDDQVNLWIEGGEGRIRMPRAMLPVIRGGEDGWFKIKSIKIGENEITASVAVNVMNNPKLRIDRLTGAISISGKAGDYVGTCQPYDPSTVQRRF
ncbi:hypothetical protein [Altererythrobacter fulvus]|uniref:hypothetical protein n=1 Tax=Caenibius fulvus TaxID=2126012 RepID=UPI003015AD4C